MPVTLPLSIEHHHCVVQVTVTVFVPPLGPAHITSLGLTESEFVVDVVPPELGLFGSFLVLQPNKHKIMHRHKKRI